MHVSVPQTHTCWMWGSLSHQPWDSVYLSIIYLIATAGVLAMATSLAVTNNIKAHGESSSCGEGGEEREGMAVCWS